MKLARPALLGFLVALACALTTEARSAPAAKPMGTIGGTVLNTETQAPVPYASVVFFRVSREDTVGAYAADCVSDEKGAYRVEVEPGSYRAMVTHISFRPYQRGGLKVSTGAATPMDILLVPAAVEMEAVQVKGKVVRTAEGAMITRLRKEVGVANAITADQIRKSTDSDAAEAVQRVSGVSVVSGRYVYVRGLGERYTGTQVNGAAVGTPEPNKRVVPLNLFPTAVLDNVVVSKTYTADMDGEFGGSVISLNTRDYLERRTFQQSLSLSYTGDAGHYLDYRDGQFDFLGFDDGSRGFPGEVAEWTKGKRIDGNNFTAAELGTMGQAFSNVWTPARERLGPNWSYSALYSNPVSIFGKEAGYLLSVALSNAFNSIEKEDNSYRGTGVDLSPNILSTVDESSQSVLGGLTGNFAVNPGERSKVKLNVLYTRQSEDKSRVAMAQNNDRGSNMRITQLGYVQRGLLSGVLQGEAPAPVLRSRVRWNLAYSEALNDEPDRRTSVYEDQGTGYALGGGSTYPLTRIFGRSTDYDRSGKLDWTIPFTLRKDGEGSLMTGYAVHDKSRFSEYRRFGFTCRHRTPCDGVDLTLPPEGIVSAPNLAQDLFRMEELTQSNDAYRAFHDTEALFASLDVPVLPRLRMVAGLRYESSNQTVEAQSNFARTRTPTFVDHSDDELLPTINVTVVPHHNMNLRLGYSRTVNRPELRELSPFSMYNFETGYSETGDTTLVTAKLQNWDLRWELYPGPAEFMALGLFYKDFRDPIQKFVSETTGGYALAPQNGEQALLRGWEAEMRVSFATLWKAMDWLVDLGGPIPPAGLIPFSMMANYSRVFSEVVIFDNVDAQGRPIFLEKPFTGQSKYSTNLGLYYGHKLWEGSLLYKAFGKRVDAYGTGSLPDIYEFPAESLDLALGYRLNHNTRLKLTAENLLDQETVFRQDARITQRWNTGTRVGLTVTFEPSSGSR